MKLTAQLHAEVEAIMTRYDQMNLEFQTKRMEVLRKRGISSEDKDIFRSIMEELNPYKVRLENILCETDVKGQGHLLNSVWIFWNTSLVNIIVHSLWSVAYGW